MNKQQVSDVHQRIRLLKHIKHSKSASYRIRRIIEKKQFRANAKLKLIEYKHNPILRILKISRCSNKTKSTIQINTPKNFCLLNNPVCVLNWLSKFQCLALTESINHIIINHCKTKKYSLAAEALLGIISNEIKELRKHANNIIKIDGIVDNDHAYNQLLEQIGIVSEMQDAKMVLSNRDTSIDHKKIHAFKQNSNLNENASQTANDLNNKTTLKLLEHINSGLRDHRLKLTKEAQNNLKLCVGEVLDNVGEHCGLTAPHWFVRGYLNNHHKNKTFELMIMNAGLPISDTFTNLPNEHYSKKLAMEYVNLHKNKVDEGTLFTIAALQGNMSSKNKKQTDTRGQGTIHLIEAFEQISRDYGNLRNNKTNVHIQPKMSIISGHTIINFNGTFKSHKIENEETGEERVIFSFNKQNCLKISPDKSTLINMKSNNFSGLLINIQIPLDGSFTSIK